MYASRPAIVANAGGLHARQCCTRGRSPRPTGAVGLGPSAGDRKRRLVGRTVQLPVHPWLVITMWAPTRDWLLMICTPTPLGRAEGRMAMAVECPWGRPGGARSVKTFC